MTAMIVSFFESMKYVGHMLPVAFLRVYTGYYFFNRAMEHFDGDFLVQPILSRSIDEWLPVSQAPEWYKDVLESIVVPNWKIFAYLVTYCEFAIGICFIIGFFVRPTALLGIFLTANLFYQTGPFVSDLHRLFLAIFMMMWWVGAGRCMGMDYFFYKRQRGIWW
ncbi:MAG: DoxX family membrane protein [Bdellovibrionales bacterium]|nr:DoxX family membrane protein [Bdellovibrionales bacterium]